MKNQDQPYPTGDEIEDDNVALIKELVHWYGGFDDFRKKLVEIEENEKIASSEKYFERDL